jgi:hypothetical protein
VLAGDLELPALDLDFVKEPGVLNGQRGLGSEVLSNRTVSGSNSPGVLRVTASTPITSVGGRQKARESERAELKGLRGRAT